MEDEGLVVDWDFIDEAKARASQFKDKVQIGLTGHLSERLGRPVGKFNPNSPVQLRKYMYSPPPDGLGLTTRIRTQGKADGSGKQMSTNAIALKILSADSFVRRMQDYRGMSKLLGTYLEPWRDEYGWCEDGRAHCHLLPHGTVTGRFSSTDFNYQNLPKKYHYECDGATFDFNFRDSVIAPPGWWGMGFDISQGELRILAAEAGEQAMLEAFARGEDLHALTASRLLHLSLEAVYEGGELFGKTWRPEDGGFRPFGKTMNFALGYQLTVQGLADRLGCSVDEAQEAWDSFFAAYPAISAWTRRTVADSKVNGRTESRFGRRHPIWAYRKNHCWQHEIRVDRCFNCDKTAQRNEAEGERTAGNAPIQGGLADMMKLIMIRTDVALARAGLKDRVRLVLNVHDSLEYYVHDDVDPQQVIDVLYPAIVGQTPWTRHWPVMRPDWHMWSKWGSPVEVKLDEDNQICGLGDILDIGLQEDEEDEEDADAAPVLSGAGTDVPVPATGGGSLLGVVASSVGSDPGRVLHSGRVLVKVREMPELAAVKRLMVLISEYPGPNQLDLVTPDGTITLSSGTALSPEDGSRVSLLLGAVEAVCWSPDTVDQSALAKGLAL